MPTAFITHADCLKHDMGAHHPERPARLTAIEDQLIASGVGQHLTRFEAPLATDEQLARVHPPEYVQAIRDAAPRSGTVHLDPDTAMNPYTLQAALRGAGAAVAGSRPGIVSQKSKAHSARSARRATTPAARGRWASASSTTSRSRRATRSRRTASSASRSSTSTCTTATAPRTSSRATSSVLMASIFQHPFYPYSGTDSPASNMVNVPLARRRRLARVPPGGAAGMDPGARRIPAAAGDLLRRLRRARRGRHGDAALRRRRLRLGHRAAEERGRAPRRRRAWCRCSKAATRSPRSAAARSSTSR